MTEQGEVTLTQILESAEIHKLLQGSALQVLFGDACPELDNLLTEKVLPDDEILGNQETQETITLCQNGGELTTLVIGENNAAVVHHNQRRGYVMEPRSNTASTEYSVHVSAQDRAEALNDFTRQILILRSQELGHKNLNLTSKPRNVKINDLASINGTIRISKDEENGDTQVTETNLLNLYKKHGFGLPKCLAVIGEPNDPDLTICVFSRFSVVISKNPEIENKPYTHLEALRILIEALRIKEE